MGRPRSENPLSARVSVRCTPGERAGLEAQARAAGVTVTDHARRVLFGWRVKSPKRTEPGSGPAASNEAAEEEPAPERMPDRRDPAAWWCPRPLCQKRSNEKGALCPTHGVAMTMKGAG